MTSLRINSDNENSMHFLTLTVIEWIDIFAKPQYGDVIIDSLKFCQKNKRLKLFEYVIMTNHIHLIVKAEENKLSQIISDFKKYTTRKILKLLESDRRGYILNLIKNSFAKKKDYENQIWQRENYPEIITSEKFLFEKIKYIHNNPVKKNYVTLPENWFYSSARNRILNDNSLIQLDDIT
jgi:REP element-mobilizing transposase RayT